MFVKISVTLKKVNDSVGMRSDYFIVFVLTVTFLEGAFGQKINAAARLITFNTGLTPRVEHYDVRKGRVGTALRDLEADVLCLQEVSLLLNN